MEPRRVLVVEDEETIGLVIRETLEDHECEVSLAQSAEEALQLLGQRTFDAALLDIVLPGASGLELLQQIKKSWPEIAIVMMTSQSSLDTAVEAIREGAYDYLRKPFEDIEDIWIGVRRALEKAHLTRNSRNYLEALTGQNEALADSVRRLTSVIEASRAMGDFQSLPELFELFVGLVSEELGVDRISLMLVDQAGECLTIAAHRGIEDIDAGTAQVRLGEGIAGQVARDGRPFLVEDVRTDPRMCGSEKPDLANSFISAPLVLSVPVMSHALVLGVLNVTNRASGAPFTPEDLDYVQGMASQIAVTIESARRFEELQSAYESLRDAQQQLVASERLKAVGQMAAGVAHDFNNALAVILGRTEICLQHLDAEEEIDRGMLRAHLEAVTKVSLQGAETIRRVQDFTRIRKDTPQGTVDLEEVIRDALEMTRPKWQGEAGSRGKEIQLELDLSGIPPVRGNQHELSQVLSNLIFNAVDAMPDGGRLAVRTFAAGGRVLVDVEDSGAGMGEEVRRRLFEPFFTTKQTGNGLGMSIVYGIVQRHDGEITVDSEPGRGTRFCLGFPVGSGSDASAADALEPEESCERGRILLVDDDEIVRETVQTVLESEGHAVVPVASGQEALEAFDPTRFDIVITDFNMPGMSGVELADRLRERDGELPIVLLSGWSVQEEEKEVRRAGIRFTLPKPCPADRMNQTIRRALMSRQAAGPVPPAHGADVRESAVPRGGAR